MTDVTPTSEEDPLVAALREENERLRAQNRLLIDQMAASRAAQDDLAKHLRVTAPLRRVQESLRHRAGERRRGAAGGTRFAPPASVPPRPPSALLITDDQASRHPLLSRTRDWLASGSLPESDVRPLRPGCAGRVLVVAHVFYPELWAPLAERIARIPAAGRSGRHPGRRALRSPRRFDRGAVPQRTVRGRAQPRSGHVAIRPDPGARAGRRLRRRAQAAHQSQRAPDRRGRLARPAAGLPVSLAGGDRADPGAVSPRPGCRHGGTRRGGARSGVLGVERADGGRVGRADGDRRRPRAGLVPGGVDVLEPTRAPEPAARHAAHNRGLRARGGVDRWDDGSRPGAVRGSAGRRRQDVRHRGGRGGR